MNYTDIKLETLQDKDLMLTLDNKIGEGLSSVTDEKYVISDDKKKTFSVDTNNL